MTFHYSISICFCCQMTSDFSGPYNYSVKVHGRYLTIFDETGKQLEEIIIQPKKDIKREKKNNNTISRILINSVTILTWTLYGQH